MLYRAFNRENFDELFDLVSTFPVYCHTTLYRSTIHSYHLNDIALNCTFLGEMCVGTLTLPTRLPDMTYLFKCFAIPMTCPLRIRFKKSSSLTVGSHLVVPLVLLRSMSASYYLSSGLLVHRSSKGKITHNINETFLF